MWRQLLTLLTYNSAIRESLRLGKVDCPLKTGCILEGELVVYSTKVITPSYDIKASHFLTHNRTKRFYHFTRYGNMSLDLVLSLEQTEIHSLSFPNP